MPETVDASVEVRSRRSAISVPYQVPRRCIAMEKHRHHLLIAVHSADRMFGDIEMNDTATVDGEGR